MVASERAGLPGRLQVHLRQPQNSKSLIALTSRPVGRDGRPVSVYSPNLLPPAIRASRSLPSLHPLLGSPLRSPSPAARRSGWSDDEGLSWSRSTSPHLVATRPRLSPHQAPLGRAGSIHTFRMPVCLNDLVDDPAFEDVVIDSVFGNASSMLSSPVLPPPPSSIQPLSEMSPSTSASPSPSRARGTRFQLSPLPKQPPISISFDGASSPRSSALNSISPLGRDSPAHSNWKTGVGKTNERNERKCKSGKGLAKLLEDSIALTPYEKLRKNGLWGDVNNKVLLLRKRLTDSEIMDRVVDLFRKFDVDQSGNIDRGEFTECVKAVFMHCESPEAEALFHEFDEDGESCHHAMAKSPCTLRTHDSCPCHHHDLQVAV